MTQKALASWLQTPRGVIALLGGSLAASVVLALAIGSQRAWFERHVRDKYEPVTVGTSELGRRLADPDAVARVRGLPARDKERLYGAWMEGAEGWPPQAPRLMVAADPFFLSRAEATLLVGTAEQRRRAVQFLIASADVRAAAALHDASRRARRRRDEAFAKEVEAAVSALAQGSRRQGG